MNKSFLVLLMAVFLVTACDRIKSVSSKDVELQEAIASTEIELVEFTQQFTVPGMESNLRGTQNYQIVLNANFKDSTIINYFYVDSIIIPINSILVDGKRWKANNFLIGEYKNLTIFVSRNVYSSRGSLSNNNLTETKYELSKDVLPNGHGVLVYTVFNELTSIKTRFPLGEYTKKDDIYRP